MSADGYSADCHRSASQTACISRSSVNIADGATIEPPPCSEEQVEVHGGLSCEIVSDLCPNPFSHDWHVQPSCQRPNRIPPERREFSPGELAQGESDCPRNFTNIRCG